MSGLLDGIVIADFSRVLAGPLATSTLADLGARVIKVERPGVGDDTRHWGPPWTPTTSAYFECANRSKESIELDLDDAADRALAKQLMTQADVVVENFRTGALDNKGLGYEDVRADNPRLIYCSISGFGSSQGAALPGYDFLVQAVGGLMSLTGSEQGDPTKVGVALVDVLSSKDAVIGILAALHERHTSGLGQRVEVNLLSSLLGSLANQASSFLATGQSPTRMGNQHPSIAPYETLQCNGGIIAVCCGNDAQFGRLVEALGQSHLAADPRFKRNSSRVENRAELIPILEAALASREPAHWIRAFTDVGVPAGEVGSIASAFDLATTLGLSPRIDVGPDAIDQVRNPVSFSRTPVDNYRRPPGLGEHNEVVRARYAAE